MIVDRQSTHTMSQASKVTRKRRPKADMRPSKRSKVAEHSAQNEIDIILKEYQDKAHDVSADSSATSVWLALNVVLDHSSFEKSLLQHDLSTKHEDNIVPLVTRAYEESLMRECISDEDKPCSLGQYCECNFIDSEHSFVGVTFVMPDLQSLENNMCILCLRKLTQMLFYRIVNGAYKSSHLAQTYGNICDVPGEYHSSAMLVLPKHSAVHSMPLPVVAHQRNKYHVVLRDGRRHLEQNNVYYEDFP
jgi:hypothetical protein